MNDSELYHWWGYLHTNGNIQVKRYWDERDLADAHESPFVQQVWGPFLAAGREEAIAHIRNKMLQTKA